MARVLFTSCPLYGHVLPMLPLIRAAGRAGHDVRVATGPDLSRHTEQPRARRPRGRTNVCGVVGRARGRLGRPWPVRGAEDDGRGRGAVRHAGARPARRPPSHGRGVAAGRRRPRGAGVGGNLARHEARGPRGRPRHRTDVPALCPAHRLCGCRDRPARTVGAGLVRASPGHLPPVAAARRRSTAVAERDAAAAECRRARARCQPGGRCTRGRRAPRVLHPRHGQEHRDGRLQGRAHRLGGVRRRRDRHDGTSVGSGGARTRSFERHHRGVRPPRCRARARRPAGLPQRVGHDARRPGARRSPGRPAAGERTSHRTPHCCSAAAPVWSSSHTTTPSEPSTRPSGR